MTLPGPGSVQSNNRQTAQSVLEDLGKVLLREMYLFLNNGWATDNTYINID